jgi:hypothetical protein
LKINFLNPEMSVRKVITSALGIAFLTAFAWVGGASLITAVKRDPLNLPQYPELSSDSFLSHIGGPHPTKTVNETLRSWGEDQALLVVAPATSAFSTAIYYELLILGYPRRIPAIMCDPHVARTGTAFHPELASTKIDGLIFFDIVPGSEVTGARQVAPALYVAPYKGVPAWNSFCP